MDQNDNIISVKSGSTLFTAVGLDAHVVTENSDVAGTKKGVLHMTAGGLKVLNLGKKGLKTYNWLMTLLYTGNDHHQEFATSGGISWINDLLDCCALNFSRNDPRVASTSDLTVPHVVAAAMLDGAGVRAIAGRFPVSQYTKFDGPFGSVYLRVRRALGEDGRPVFHPTTRHQSTVEACSGGWPAAYVQLVATIGAKHASAFYNYYKGRKQLIPLPLQLWSSGADHMGFGLFKLLFGVLGQSLEAVGGTAIMNLYANHVRNYGVYMRWKDYGQGRKQVKTKDSGKGSRFLRMGPKHVLCVDPSIRAPRDCKGNQFYFDLQSREVRWLPPHLHKLLEPIFRRTAEFLNMIEVHDRDEYAVKRKAFQRLAQVLLCYNCCIITTNLS